MKRVVFFIFFFDILTISFLGFFYGRKAKLKRYTGLIRPLTGLVEVFIKWPLSFEWPWTILWVCVACVLLDCWAVWLWPSVAMVTTIINYCYYECIYLPMHRYAEDGPDVGQHGLKALWVFLEAHLGQDHGLIDILERKHKHRNILGWNQ